MSFLNDLELHKIIAIVRGITRAQAGQTIEALSVGGIRFVEVTMNTKDWSSMLREWRSQYEGRMWVGAGTVLDLGMAKEASAAGAQFLVTPNTDIEVIEYAVSKGIPVIPGALTPTEIVTAWRAGATAVKLFPMSTFGLSYFKEICAPLDQIRIVPTGGINLNNIAEFVLAGAFGFGMGGSLVNKDAINQGRYADITEAARALVHAVQLASTK